MLMPVMQVGRMGMGMRKFVMLMFVGMRDWLS